MFCSRRPFWKRVCTIWKTSISRLLSEKVRKEIREIRFWQFPALEERTGFPQFLCFGGKNLPAIWNKNWTLSKMILSMMLLNWWSCRLSFSLNVWCFSWHQSQWVKRGLAPALSACILFPRVRPKLHLVVTINENSRLVWCYGIVDGLDLLFHFRIVEERHSTSTFLAWKTTLMASVSVNWSSALRLLSLE